MYACTGGHGADIALGDSAAVHGDEQTLPSGGQETRSKNVSVYFYIKID
jgi:hypothetical protein